MAERPIFIPSPDTPELVKEIFCQLEWNAGFAPIQKKKNVAALHAAAAKRGFSPLLEVSTKSESPLGEYLSAFNLKVNTWQFGEIPMECAFQGSKVFEGGGPYTDLYTADDVKSARRDLRLQESGRLIGFEFEGKSFPLEPKTSFYDWLYISAIYPCQEQFSALKQYAGFTDIEFNPYRSINCQARSCALFVALLSKRLLTEAMTAPEAFMEMLSRYAYRPHLAEPPNDQAHDGGAEVPTMKKFQCTVLVDSSPSGQCIRVEGHPSEHVTPRSAQGGYCCPRCKKLFASLDAFDTHVPCSA